MEGFLCARATKIELVLFIPSRRKVIFYAQICHLLTTQFANRVWLLDRRRNRLVVCDVHWLLPKCAKTLKSC